MSPCSSASRCGAISASTKRLSMSRICLCCSLHSCIVLSRGLRPPLPFVAPPRTWTVLIIESDSPPAAGDRLLDGRAMENEMDPPGQRLLEVGGQRVSPQLGIGMVIHVRAGRAEVSVVIRGPLDRIRVLAGSHDHHEPALSETATLDVRDA